MSLKLVIGNKNYSSWSLRAWLYLKESQLPFEEVRLSMFTKQWQEEITQYTPAGRVPVLIDDAITVWDSIAIMEYVRENYPGSVGWPSDRASRAHMRSIATEMHSGFLAIRAELPQNIRMRQQRSRDDFSSAAQSQIDRVEILWQDCYQKYGGPWLCGDFSIADVMYAPVALRFVTYGISLIPEAHQFVEAVQALDSIQMWVQDSASETENLPFIDTLMPASNTPLSFG
ncbi:MAG: glutathione S-transferase family protein [Cyanobacteria bacterium P01_F01_bin.86]